MLPLFILTIEDPSVREAYSKLYRSYEKFMYQVAFSVLKNQTDAEDAVHRVFLKMLENKAKPDPLDKRIKAYLGIAVKNTALNMVRDRKNDESLESLIELSDEPDTQRGIAFGLQSGSGFEPAPDPDSESYELQLAISQLPGPYKETVLLYYYEGYKIKEIASLIGKKPAAVQKSLERARAMLKEYLKED